MKNKYIILSLSVLAGFIFLYLWFVWIDFDQLLGYFKKINLFTALIAFSSYMMSYFIRSYRWKLLLSPQKKIKQSDSFAYFLAGNFINYLIPIRAGELAKCALVKKNYKIRFSHSFPSVFIDKLFDTLGLFVILLLLPFINIQLDSALYLLIYLLIFLFVIGALVLLFASLYEDKTTRLLQKIFFFFPNKYKTKFHEFIELFVQGTAIFKKHNTLLIPCVLLSFLAVFTDSFFFWNLFRSFSESISFPYVMFGYTLIYLSYVLPHPPAQIGSNELIMVLIFSVGMGLNKEMVSAVMSFSHLITGILIVISGLISVSFAGFKLLDFLKNGDDDESNEQS
jgi:uncharacterized protein (TIRG00374 family)